MKYNIEYPKKSVTVITPTIGQQEFINACDSVYNQTYSNIQHLLVVDGVNYLNNIIRNKNIELSDKNRLTIVCSPENTGSGGFYGHRIYASYPHLINTDYVAFLDEDNWYEPDHIETLVNIIEKEDLDFAYSFRNIYSKDGKFVEQDNCESIGKWPIYNTLDGWTTSKQYLVDTSAYLFKTSYLIGVSHYWHFGWGADRRFFNIIKDASVFNTTHKHTLNYRLDDNIEKKYGSIDFFKNGNEIIKKHYGGKYPWENI